MDDDLTGLTLQRARRMAGLDEREAARRLGLGRRRLRAVEGGRERASADLLERAVATYGDTALALPPRTALVRVDDPSVLVVGGERIPVDPARPDDRDLLSSYVAAVRRQRGLGPDDPVAFRSSDVAALAGVLDLTGADLEMALRTAAGLDGPVARRTAQRLVLTALCMLAAGGATFGVRSGFDLRPPAATSALAVRTEVRSPFTTRARSGPPAPDRGPRLLFDVAHPGPPVWMESIGGVDAG